ncbi:MAG: HAD-IA family hydrolase [Patescibacteria group bacterium]
MAEIEAALRKKAVGRKGYEGYSPLFASFECGEIGSMNFFHALSAVLGCSMRTDYNTFARLWVNIFDGENADLDKLLLELPQKKYLLSNANALVNERYIAHCAIVRNHFPLYEQRILSCNVGAIKPNPFIYKAAWARADVKPEQSLFLDDIPENIEAWRAEGGHGIVYHAGKHSIKELRKKLRTFEMPA